MRRPRWRTLINGSSRAYVDAGPDTAFGSEPPFDEDDDFDPVAEKHTERLNEVAVEKTTIAAPLKLTPVGRGKCEGSRCENVGKSVPRFSIVGQKLCFDCIPKKKP
jgi:hypothetical protein